MGLSIAAMHAVASHAKGGVGDGTDGHFDVARCMGGLPDRPVLPLATRWGLQRFERL